MAWQDRLRDAAYTSPGGTRIRFSYEDVEHEFDINGAAYQFPDASGTFVQRMNTSSRRYPLKIIFHGNDYDLQANLFETLLLEPGIGKLEHPVYGTVDVVPFGSVNRSDDLKTAGNQAVFNVTFWNTIGLVYPTNQVDPGSAVLSALEEYNTVAAEQFDALTQIDTAVEQATFKNTYQSLLNSVNATLKDVAKEEAAVGKQFNDILDSINAGIDTLVGDPLTLAFQTVILIQSPARATTGIAARLSAYDDLIGIVIGQAPLSSVDFHTRDLYASTALTGSVLSVVNNQFPYKTAALTAADELLTQFDVLTAWRDEQYGEFDETDTGETYQQLQEAVALAAGFLVEISFSLKQERQIVLDRARTIIDLCAELYGTVDDQLDFLINTNNLTGSEILELPVGRRIFYYV